MPKHKKTFFERLTGATKLAPAKPKSKPKIKDYFEKPSLKPLPEEETPPVTLTPTEKKGKPDEKEQLPAASAPASEGQLTIDVYQTETDIVIKSTIAGVSPEDIDVSISNDMVTIKGKRERDEVVKNDDYYYQECYWGAFSRSVILPVDVEADKAAANMKNGILTIRLPKVEKIKTRKIEVQSA